MKNKTVQRHSKGGSSNVAPNAEQDTQFKWQLIC